MKKILVGLVVIVVLASYSICLAAPFRIQVKDGVSGAVIEGARILVQETTRIDIIRERARAAAERRSADPYKTVAVLTPFQARSTTIAMDFDRHPVAPGLLEAVLGSFRDYRFRFIISKAGYESVTKYWSERATWDEYLVGEAPGGTDLAIVKLSRDGGVRTSPTTTLPGAKDFLPTTTPTIPIIRDFQKVPSVPPTTRMKFDIRRFR